MNAAHPAPTARQHEFEPLPGLPERLPASERLLWQGSPDWRALARRAFHLPKLALYFGVLIVWRAATVAADGGSVADVLLSLPGPLAIAGLGLGLVAILAWLSARTALYTITDRRVVMRIGIVLTLTFNLPLKRIAAAELAPAPRDTGDIALELAGNDRIAWLQLWPHARPWRLGKPQPMLRCVPQGAQVAKLLAQTWSQVTGLDVQPIDAPDTPLPPLPAQDGHAAVPGTAMATR